MRWICALLAVIFAALLANCGGGNDPTINREFFNNSSLNANTGVISSGGDNMVFKYEFIHPDNDLTEILQFEVPGDQDRFNFTFTSGVSIPIIYQRICECPADTYSISSGVVDGAIVNEAEWRLAISVVIENSANLFLPVQDEGNYRLQN